MNAEDRALALDEIEAMRQRLWDDGFRFPPEVFQESVDEMLIVAGAAQEVASWSGVPAEDAFKRFFQLAEERLRLGYFEGGYDEKG